MGTIELTVGFARFLPQTSSHIGLELSQRGRFEGLEVDLDLLGVRVAQRGLTRLNDVHHPAQFVARQLVDVQAELPLGVVAHGQAVFFLFGIVERHGRGGGREPSRGRGRLLSRPARPTRKDSLITQKSHFHTTVISYRSSTPLAHLLKMGFLFWYVGPKSRLNPDFTTHLLLLVFFLAGALF